MGLNFFNEHKWKGGTGSVLFFFFYEKSTHVGYIVGGVGFTPNLFNAIDRPTFNLLVLQTIEDYRGK